MKSNKKEPKICFAASSGGHLEQLLMLKDVMSKYDSFIVTEKTDYKIKTEETVYHVLQVNRKEHGFLMKMIANLFISVNIFIKEKPDVVITTGVLATIPMALLAKICGKKLVYIESFAKINSPTKTGKFLYKFADRFYVQWSSLLDVYPNAVYIGGIY